MDSRATRQVISAGTGLTTPHTGQVVAGTAVAVAAIQGAGPDTIISAPVRVAAANTAVGDTFQMSAEAGGGTSFITIATDD